MFWFIVCYSYSEVDDLSLKNNTYCKMVDNIPDDLIVLAVASPHLTSNFFHVSHICLRKYKTVIRFYRFFKAQSFNLLIPISL